MPPGVEQSSFPRVFPKPGLQGKHPCSVCLYIFLSTVLTAVDAVNRKEMNNNQDVPSECHHARTRNSKKSCGGMVSEEKVIFVLKGQSFQFTSTGYIKGISRELRQKPSESLLWSAKNWHYQKKQPIVIPT